MHPSLLIALYVVVTSGGLISIKMGSLGQAPISIVDGKLLLHLNPYFFGGVILYIISFFLYTFLISKYDLSYIIPLATGFIYVLIFITSYFLFAEVFTIPKIIGVTLIIIGIIFLSNSGS